MRLIPLLLVLTVHAFAAPKEIWTVNTGLSNPESSYYDPETKTIYVSNVAGGGTDKDGKGWISKVGVDGKMIAEKWVEGLNAPKGIRISKGKLWVSDIDTVVGIDIAAGKVTDKIQIAEAKFLNDVAIGEDGTIYVSDMFDPKIYAIKGDNFQVLLSGADLESPNGLFVKDGALYVTGWGVGIKPDFSTAKDGGLYSIDFKTKKIKRHSGVLGKLDGLEFETGDTWLVTDWMKGDVFRYNAKTRKKTMLLQGLKGAADIGYIADKKVLLVPEMNASKLHAYQLD